jgi:protocatechuate 3,4-dioxygenase beta subunit
MSNLRIQKGITITLLAAVLLSMMLGSNTVELALAQLANQSSSSSSSATPSPPPTTPQASTSTFHAKGVIGILVLNPNATQAAPPPSKYFGTIVGGNWSLDVVDRSLQNLRMNLLSIRPDGTIAEAALVSTVTNNMNNTSSAASVSSATTSIDNINNSGSVATNNSRVFQGVVNVSINGTVRWRDVPFAITMMRGTLINISIDNTKTGNQFGGLPIHGIIMSMTDERGRNLLPGLPYFVSSTSTLGQFGGAPSGAGGGGPPPGSGPAERSTQIGTIPTNQTCTLTPSIKEVEATPQQTEGPYFVDEKLNRSDIKSDPSNGAQEGVPMNLVIHVYDVDNGACVPLKGAQVDIWHANASGVYSDVQQMGTQGNKFLRGYQVTDDNGTVRFTTIYPGWYPGRAVHIHFKIRTFEGANETLEFTSQFFFNDTISDQVYSQSPYREHGIRDTRNSQDSIFNGASLDGSVQTHAGEHVMLNVTKQDQGYLGTFNVGLKLNKTEDNSRNQS